MARRNANRGNSRESIRRKNPIFITGERFARIASNLRFANFKAPRSAIRKKEEFGNPETIRENQTIRANLQIDSRELGHLSTHHMPCGPKRYKGHFRENQTCTDLRSTISRHLLPPISRWVHTEDSVEIVRLPIETGHFPVPENGKFPFGKMGAKATRNGNHDLVHV